MADITLPSYPPKDLRQASDALAGILEHDQFDDWLPDAAYFEDVRLNPQPMTSRVGAAWSAHRWTGPDPVRLEIPRGSGPGFSALAVPLDLRCCLHQSIAAMAPRVSAALQRDKIYGFEFNAGQVPLFTPPGDGLKDAIDTALAAAVAAQTSLTVLDIVSFNRSLRFDALAQTLQRFGARADELNLLRAVVGTGEAGLPSIDDAIAFVYNFYLEPVDRALLKSRVNVFRYRDEYFAPGKRAEAAVMTQLKALGLTAVVTVRFTGLEKEEHEVDWTEDGQTDVRIISPFLEGEVTSLIECQTYDEEQKACVTDHYEVKYEGRGLASLADLFALNPAAGLDGVKVLPLLRQVHERRREGVFLAPPFTAPPQGFAEYQKIAAPGRAWLTGALGAAVKSATAWPITWIAAMLSDLGTLRQAEIQLLLAAARAPDVAAPYARLALARSSTLPAEQCWVMPPATASVHEQRAALLCAGYLAKRRIAGPWDQVRKLWPEHQSLAERIDAYIRSTI